MQIKSSIGTVSRLTANCWRQLPSGEAGYRYERELPQSGFRVQIDYLGYCDRDTNGVCVALSFYYDHGIYKGNYYVWRGCFVPRELLSDGVLTVPPIFTLDMSLEKIEQAKLEDFQSLIDIVDKIEDTPDVPEQIERIAENNGLIEDPF